MRALFSRTMAAAVIAAAVFAAAGAGRAQTVTVIHRFAGGADGANPHAGLAYLGGYLYGTTEVGGSGMGCSNGAIGCGTAFEMTLDGVEFHRHTFTGSPDGAFPYGDLLVVGNELFGTTYNGGDTGCGGKGCGTVFEMPQTRVVRTFTGNPDDGANPVAGLTCAAVTGTCTSTDELFGATQTGGTNNFGAVFELDDKEPVFSFKGGVDGAYPYGTLVSVSVSGSDVLYGTTSAGGNKNNCSNGCGTLFGRKNNGEVLIGHYFRGGDFDGAAPYAGLIFLDNYLYGTTSAGGGKGCGGAGCGTVYRSLLSGIEVPIHYFQGNNDGAVPLAGLLNVGGTLYGTTEYGGGQGADSCPWGGCGTLFTEDPSSQVLTVIYGFPGGNEGARPAGKLINVGSTLYGTTYSGGGTGCGGTGCGTVFKVTFP